MLVMYTAAPGKKLQFSFVSFRDAVKVVLNVHYRAFTHTQTVR